MLETTVKCNKNLSDNDGQQFTKGNIYKGRICNVLENLQVTNDSGEPHILGLWAKHFKNVSKYNL